MQALYEVIRRPVITEKSMDHVKGQNRYAFEVSLKSNKQEIKDVVQRIFKVKVLTVKTMIMHGKMKRLGRSQVKSANWKKALVSLVEGQTIDLFQTK